LNCPKCGSSNVTVAADGILNCNDCTNYFPAPDIAPIVPPDESEREDERRAMQDYYRVKKIRSQAKSFITLSLVIFFLGVLLLFAGIYGSIGVDAPGGDICWLLMASAWGLSIWLYLIGQIIHIRANTEK